MKGGDNLRLVNWLLEVNWAVWLFIGVMVGAGHWWLAAGGLVIWFAIERWCYGVLASDGVNDAEFDRLFTDSAVSE